MPIWLIVVAAFVVGVGMVAGLAVGAANLPGYLMRRRIEQRLRESGIDLTEADANPTVVKRENAGPLPGLERLYAELCAGRGVPSVRSRRCRAGRSRARPAPARRGRDNGRSR